MEAKRLAEAQSIIRALYHLHFEPSQRPEAEALAADLDLALPRMMRTLHQPGLPAPVALYLPATPVADDEPAPLHTLLRAFADDLLALRSAAKPAGWRWDEAPAWFRQGYLDYLALATLEPEVRDEVIEQCRDLVRAQPELIEADETDFRLLDDQVGGLVLVAFFHFHWGRYAGLQLLESPEPTLTAAMEAVFGLTPPQIHEVCFSYLFSPFHEH